jgi:hypothetical protein
MASADDRAQHRNPLEHHLENGRREVAWWQPHEGDCALPSRKLKRLRERLRRGRGDENTVRTAARRLQDFVNRLRRARIDRYCGTDLFGQCELFWGNIDGRDMQAHSLRILDREMPEAADPRNRDPFSWPCLCLFQAFVCSYPCTQDRRDVRELGAFVKPRGEVGGGNEILGESAVDTVACVALTLAEGLPAGLAIFAPQAAIVQSGNAYGIALLEVLNAGAERCDSACHLVRWHERYVRLYRPIPIGPRAGPCDKRRTL